MVQATHKLLRNYTHSTSVHMKVFLEEEGVRGSVVLVILLHRINDIYMFKLEVQQGSNYILQGLRIVPICIPNQTQQGHYLPLLSPY